MPVPKVEVSKRRRVVDVTVRGRVIARVVLDGDRQAVAREHLKALRRSARIVGDIMSPSGETWDAERGRVLR
jgi:hypothetical protein